MVKNWVQKYVEDVLCDLENSTIENNKLFLNGVSVKSDGIDMELLIYQLPFSDIIFEVVYGENHVELYTNRIMYSNQDNEWIILSTIEPIGANS